MKNQIANFIGFKLSNDQLSQVTGGSGCACHQAAPYACSAAGYTEGTGAYLNCMQYTYWDCCGLVPSCVCIS